jgi:RNA polymerase sigma-70 factor (ECF subfamily)
VAALVRPGFVSDLACRAPTDVTDVAAEKERLSTLYAEQGARVFRFLRDLLGDSALAADATQETFVRAYKKLSSLDETARVAPWLFGIARNVSLEMRRARFRAGRYIVSDDGQAGEMVAAFGSPETDYLGREALDVVGAALAKLSEERRAMLLMRLDHGLAYDDIASAMGCSLAKVKVEIFRAREVLRETMADYEDGRAR